MASGEFAEPIYDLLDELGGHEASSNFVLTELIKFLPSDTIRDFVDHFRNNYDMKESIVQTHFAVNVDDETEDFEESLGTKQCKTDTTNPPTGTSKFFSSSIPEC